MTVKTNNRSPIATLGNNNLTIPNLSKKKNKSSLLAARLKMIKFNI
uniref:Uncharacterized protein n=1 Tax=uncultured Elusimicrobia bacterium TaxID=699876 RepID=A0A650ELN1_9BACT|nr:hypothetical protein Elusimicrob1349_1290 [uncultured Elusimicrobia bacterium]